MRYRNPVRILASAIWVVSLVNSAQAAPEDSLDRSYGSGNHGVWIEDEFGLPAYQYTGCTDVSKPCIDGQDVVHQLGNDGVNALAHGDGYVELYSARSYHRFANHYNEAARDYAGGFGWVKDGSSTFSTLWKDRPANSRYERVFGMGYFKKTIEVNGLQVDHYIYLTEGEDAVLRERIIFTNKSPLRKSISYVDYWDVAWFHPRIINGKVSSEYDDATVVTAYDAEQRLLKAISQAEARDTERPDFWRDPVPQVSFVWHRRDAPQSFETLQSAFFGNGDRQLPEALQLSSLQNGLHAEGTLHNKDSVLATEKSFDLAPGAHKILDLAFGLSPKDELAALVKRLEKEPDFTLPRIAARWALKIPRVNFPGHSWLGRELAWSYYYLRSGVLREDFFEARNLNQGSIYLYEWGTNSGPRSTFRHLLPLIYTDPDLAQESLLYFLRAMKPNGELPYSTAGYGAWHKQELTPSDHSFWLLAAALEYVHVTRDYGFLDKRINYWCEEGRGRCGSATIWESLVAAYLYTKNEVGTGSHGLVRLLNSDWDDFLVLFSPDRNSTINLGESTMNTALALQTYPAFAELAEMRGDFATSNSVRNDWERLRIAMLEQWRGDHFNRGYVYTAAQQPVELGARSVWMASNGIALGVPGLIDMNQRQQLIARIERDNFNPSPVGLAAIGSEVFEGGTPGNWYSLAGPTIESLLFQGERDLAFRMFLKQTLANHAATHPEYAPGIWSGPDMYFTPLDEKANLGRAGSTWCFQNMCMGHLPYTNMFAHSEPLLSSLRVAGIRADARGYVVDPGAPGPYSWTSPRFGLIYSENSVVGWMRAIANDKLSYRIRLPDSMRDNPQILVNGILVRSQLEWKARGDGSLERFAVFDLPLHAGQYVHWLLH